jgi:CRISPR-associated protein Csb2
MVTRALLIEVALLGDRWHGVGDWPPSAFRLFQALVAGAYGGRWAGEDEAAKDASFRWLESLEPPRIAAPPRRRLNSTTYFVPNNDLDAVGGDPARIGEIRAAKSVSPVLFEGDPVFIYAWGFDDGEAWARAVCDLAERLHTFGRGVDAAFARAEVVSPQEADNRLAAPGRTLSSPVGHVGADTSPCPTPGSLDSLKQRHTMAVDRFETQGSGRKRLVLFRQPPKALSRSIAYDRPSLFLTYEIRMSGELSRFHPEAQGRAREIVETVRNRAAERLTAALPALAPVIGRFLVGHGASDRDKDARIRLLAMPTIGHPKASPSIRRIVAEVPPDCPLSADDIAWALTGLTLDLIDPETGVVRAEAVLVPTEDRAMTEHYGLGSSARLWRSVTPLALPRRPARGRSGGERADAESTAVAELAASLRHAGIRQRPISVRLQREPFLERGLSADAFVAGRFAGRLRHAEIRFEAPVSGPLVLGDGRFVGLGLMRPVAEPPPDLHVFSIKGDRPAPAGSARLLAQALRRAVMSRAAVRPGDEFFTGHPTEGGAARSGRHEHLFFLAEDCDGDGILDRLSVIAPHMADRTSERSGRDVAELEKALAGFTGLRAGRIGLFSLLSAPPTPSDRTFGEAMIWTSQTAYRVTRHPRRGDDPAEAVRRDLTTECSRRGLPLAEIDILGIATGAKGGLTARARLGFRTAVRGPILLGRGSHFGEGLFHAELP